MNLQNWEKLNYSKAEIKRATKKIIEENLSYEEEVKCYYQLANFRSSYEYPMQTMINHFRNKAFEIDKKAIIVRRLKRIPSILAKVKRGVDIGSMNDIGGIRIITQNLKMVEQIRDKLCKSRSKNKLIKEYDYLKESKKSGYRGIHLIYSYQGDKEEYQNYRIELQIRSKIQHAWATAVEVVGTFNKQSLKSGEGDKEWLNFFELVSSAFQFIELKKLEEYQKSDDFKKLIKKEKDLKVINHLKAYKMIISNIPKEKGNFLLRLKINTINHEILIQHYPENFFTEAKADYRRIETEIKDSKNKDVVLVNAKSVNELKKAYPNYFADTTFFIETLAKIIKK